MFSRLLSIPNSKHPQWMLLTEKNEVSEDISLTLMFG